MRIRIVGHCLNRFVIADLGGKKSEPAEVEGRGIAHILPRRPFQHRRYVTLLLIRVDTLDELLVPHVLGVAVPAIGPRIGRRNDLIFSDFQKIHRGFSVGVDVVPLHHHVLELLFDLGREPGAVRQVVRHEAKNRMLVALGVDGIALALDPAEMTFLKLIVDDRRQPVVIVFHLDGVLAILRRGIAKRERPWFIVAVVVEQRLVQANHLQQVTAVHDVLLDVGIDPTVPVVLGTPQVLTALLGSSRNIVLADVCPVIPHVPCISFS